MQMKHLENSLNMQIDSVILGWPQTLKPMLLLGSPPFEEDWFMPQTQRRKGIGANDTWGWASAPGQTERTLGGGALSGPLAPPHRRGRIIPVVQGCGAVPRPPPAPTSSRHVTQAEPWPGSARRLRGMGPENLLWAPPSSSSGLRPILPSSWI